MKCLNGSMSAAASLLLICNVSPQPVQEFAGFEEALQEAQGQGNHLAVYFYSEA